MARKEKVEPEDISRSQKNQEQELRVTDLVDVVDLKPVWGSQISQIRISEYNSTKWMMDSRTENQLWPLFVWSNRRGGRLVGETAVERKGLNESRWLIMDKPGGSSWEGKEESTLLASIWEEATFTKEKTASSNNYVAATDKLVKSHKLTEGLCITFSHGMPRINVASWW